jgi:hypothetical protein
MICIDIPYFFENKRIDKTLAKKELQSLDVGESVKENAFAAIYNHKPREVFFEKKDLVKANLLERALVSLGVPYRRSEKSDY